MALHHDHDGGILEEIVEEALKPPPQPDPDEPRDPAWLQWLERGALIVGPAIVFGLAFAFRDFLSQISSHHYQIEQAQQSMQNDTVAAMKWRFVIGAAFGAVLGAVYVVRRIVRNVDP